MVAAGACHDLPRAPHHIDAGHQIPRVNERALDLGDQELQIVRFDRGVIGGNLQATAGGEVGLGQLADQVCHLAADLGERISDRMCSAHRTVTPIQVAVQACNGANERTGGGGQRNDKARSVFGQVSKRINRITAPQLTPSFPRSPGRRLR